MTKTNGREKGQSGVRVDEQASTNRGSYKSEVWGNKNRTNEIVRTPVLSLLLLEGKKSKSTVNVFRYQHLTSMINISGTGGEGRGGGKRQRVFHFSRRPQQMRINQHEWTRSKSTP